MAAWQTDNYGEENPHTGDLAGGAYIATGRIIALSVISFGIYWIYWMYRTWKQYRDHTGEEAYPVWHGLTQLVPVYGFFRFHAHARVFKTLMQRRGVPDTLNLDALVVIVVVNTIANLVAGGLSNSSSVSLTVRLVAFVVQLATIAVGIGVLCRIQSNLNRYWADVDHRLTQSARFGKGEIVCIGLGIIAWLGSIAGIIWPT